MKVNNEPKVLTASDEIREVAVQTPVSLENDLSILDDLSLSFENENGIKAGAPCLGCNWGPPVTNHNETAVSDEAEEEAELNDLPVLNEREEEVKGGLGGGVNTPGPILNHNETIADDGAEADTLDDLAVADEQA